MEVSDVAGEAGLWLVVGSGEPGNVEFGRLIRRARVSADLSAQEVAVQTGVSASFVRAVERGERAPSKESGLKLIDAVGIPRVGRVEAGPYDVVIDDPSAEGGEKIYVVFKALRQGDNSRWALDRLRQNDDGSRDAEADADVSQLAGLLFSRVFDYVHGAPMLASRSVRAPSGSRDEAYGRIVRKLALADEATLLDVEALLDRQSPSSDNRTIERWWRGVLQDDSAD